MCLTVAYDGTAFSGWQMQRAQRTVQATIAAAAATMCGGEVTVFGASRTDAGVHALGQLAAFDSDKDIDAHGWLRGLNGLLPPDVRVRAVSFREAGYNPRFDATTKRYRYLFHVGPAADPLLRNRAWHIDARLGRPRRGPRAQLEDWLDVETMRKAAEMLVGTHDFRAFQAANDPRTLTERTLTEVRVLDRFHTEPELLAVEVEGTAFLKNMVRILAGTLLEVGRERSTPVDVRALLGPNGSRRAAGPTAPPQGLTLLHIATGRLSPAG